MSTDALRAACPECGRDVLVTVTGHLRKHDVPRGARRGPLPRCPGGGEYVALYPQRPRHDPGWPASSYERPASGVPGA